MYLPLKLLNNYTEKSNISWQELDQMKRIYRKEHPLSDELYITKTEVLLAIIYKENAQLKTKLDMLQVIWIATTLSIVASWRVSKQVYHFEQELEKLLYSQAEDKILLPVDILKNMPYPCGYFETPNLLGEQFHGFFVCFDMENKMELMKFMILNNNGESVNICSIELLTGHTLKECVESPLKLQYSKQDVTTEADKYIGLVEKMLQLVLYVCAVNADIQQAEPTKKTVKPKSIADIKDKYKEVNRWNVGNHIVKKIRNLNKKCNSYKNINETEGNNPSRNINETENNEKKLQKQHHITPHVRRGHWQSYWIGKRDGSEERKLVLRWKHFIYVNATEPEKLPVMINCIKDDIRKQ